MLSWNEFVQEHVVGYSDLIKQVTRPLRDHFGITYFYHFRIDNQGNFFGLTDRPDEMDYYSSENLLSIDPYYKHPDVYHSGYFLSEENVPEEYQRGLKRIKEKFDLGSDVLLVHKNQEYVECSLFAGNQSCQLDKLHKEHPLVFKSFARYFKKQVAPILQKLEKSPVSLPALRGKDFYYNTPIQSKLDKAALCSFLEEVGMEKEVEKAKKLSKREIQCLKLLLTGKSANETAQDLSLSPRTVEFYFENIKNKLTCQSKHDLFFIAKDLEGLGLIG